MILLKRAIYMINWLENWNHLKICLKLNKWIEIWFYNFQKCASLATTNIGSFIVNSNDKYYIINSSRNAKVLPSHLRSGNSILWFTHGSAFFTIVERWAFNILFHIFQLQQSILLVLCENKIFIDGWHFSVIDIFVSLWTNE